MVDVSSFQEDSWCGWTVLDGGQEGGRGRELGRDATRRLSSSSSRRSSFLASLFAYEPLLMEWMDLFLGQRRDRLKESEGASEVSRRVSWLSSPSSPSFHRAPPPVSFTPSRQNLGCIPRVGPFLLRATKLHQEKRVEITRPTSRLGFLGLFLISRSQPSSLTPPLSIFSFPLSRARTSTVNSSGDGSQQQQPERSEDPSHFFSTQVSVKSLLRFLHAHSIMGSTVACQCFSTCFSPSLLQRFPTTRREEALVPLPLAST